MLQPPTLTTLRPQTHILPNMRPLHFFPNDALGLVKLDITLEAGSRYQPMKCLSHAANHLFGEATGQHDARQVAEFLDFRGIVVERMTDVCVGNLSFYFLRRYAEELFPLIREMYDAPLVTKPMFDACIASRRQQLATGFQKTSYVARNRFYELLYGLDHPLGTYAVPDDVDALTIECVNDFIQRHYRLPHAKMVLAAMSTMACCRSLTNTCHPLREALSQSLSYHFPTRTFTRLRIHTSHKPCSPPYA